jgi:iron complex outermembrane receptor protein
VASAEPAAGKPGEAKPAEVKPEAEPPRDRDEDEVEYFTELDVELKRIGSSLTDEVVSSTKTRQRAPKAPAVISIVTREEIQSHGYGSVAEALRSVPGLYDVYDLVSHNIGVRGINGGARAGGNILKLMIDGHPVDYRPGTSNFFGEELIPIGIIERIEIIRGPASALYGAGAFLGVVNVITRSGKSVSGIDVTVQGTAVREHELGAGTQVVQGAAGEGFDMVMAAGIWAQARSGLSIPASSPLINRPGVPPALLESSAGDVTRPRSFFTHLKMQVGPGEMSFLTSLQYVSAASEFQDVAPLTHSSRISLFNQSYRLGYQLSPLPALTLRASVGYSRAVPTTSEHLDVGRTDFDFIRVVSTDGLFLSGEGQWIQGPLNATAGVDLSSDDHLLETYDRRLLEDVLAPDGSILRGTGTIIPGIGHGNRDEFRDVGTYAQLIYDFNTSLSATLGTRLDFQNVYGINWSNRVGIVYAPPDRVLTVKALYGSSFKPPSAEQLYAQPMTLLDLKGNPGLNAQTAQTFELAGGYGFGKGRGEVLLNLFATHIFGRVEFLQRSFYLEAQNADDEWVLGGELTAAYALTRDLQVSGSASVARTALLTSPQVALDRRMVTNPLYPFLQVHLTGQYSLPLKGLMLSAEASYVSARAASQVNANLNGLAYNLEGYPFTALVLSYNRQMLPGRDTAITLRASNLLNWKWADSGFGGIDVPAQGRTVQLSITQRL